MGVLRISRLTCLCTMGFFIASGRQSIITCPRISLAFCIISTGTWSTLTLSIRRVLTRRSFKFSRPKYWLMINVSITIRLSTLRRRFSLLRTIKVKLIISLELKKAALPPRKPVITSAITKITNAKRKRANNQ